jgi:TonB family protein
MNRIHICLTENRARRAAVRLLQVAVLALVVITSIPAFAAGDREVRSRVAPVYPEIAKRMKISGAVKIEATVDADGKVTQVKALSGNQMLSGAAEEAVRKWKFESGSGQSTVNVVLEFTL